MDMLSRSLFDVHIFLEQGGTVLWMILLVSIVMWSLIIERYLFLWLTFPQDVQNTIAKWQARADRTSWYAHQVRLGLISQNRASLENYLVMIRTLTAALPMLGLLGTVDGMIQTFDVMTVFGTGNSRGMAGGISIALITTMAGLVTALSGFYFSSQLSQRALREVNNLADALRRD